MGPETNDSNGSIDELKKLTLSFIEERNWGQFHSAKDLAIGLVTEASEFLELFRFKSDEEISELLAGDFKFRNQIADELADTLYFLVRFSEKFHFDLTQSLKAKLKKNALKYPVEKSYGRNLKYTEIE